MVKKLGTLWIAAIFCFSCLTPLQLFAEAQYMVSGIVANKDDTPIRDVEIRITGEREFSAKTDVFGYYQIDGIDNGAKIEVRAFKEGLSISPEIFKISGIVSNRTVNFSASAVQAPAETPQAQPAAPAKQSTVVVSPSKTASQAGASSSKDVPVLARPVSGVTSTQPMYVTETKPFFSAPQEKQPSGTKAQAVQQKTESAPKTNFDISGKVFYYSSGLVGVRVMLNGDRRFMTTTDVNGYYSIKGLKSGQDYTISFSRDGYMFDPNDYKIESGNQDYIINVEASVSKFKISGKVFENKIAVEKVNIKVISGVDEFSTYTDANGYYEIDGLAYGNNYFVTAYKEGVLITPPKLIVNKLDNNRTVNFNAIVQKFSISGTVTDFDGEPVKGAELEFKTTFETLRTVTNSKGKYLLEDVPMALSYTVVAGKPGYVSSSPFVIESLEKDRELNFQIKKEKESGKKEKGKAPKEAASEAVTEKTVGEGSALTLALQVSDDEDEAPAVVKEKKSSSGSSRVRKEKKPKKEEQQPEPLVIVSAAEPQAAKASKNKQSETFVAADVASQEDRAFAEQEEKARKEQAKKDKEEQEKREKEEKIKKEQEEKARKEQARKDKEEQERQEKLEKEEQERIEKEAKIKKEQEEKARKEQAKEEQLREEQAKKEEKVQQRGRVKEKPAKKQSEPVVVPASSGDNANVEIISAAPAVTVAKKAKSEPGKEKTVKVKGKIESRGEALKDIEVLLVPGLSAKTDEKGRYEFAAVPAGKRYTLKASARDFHFEPQQIVYDDLKSAVNQDFAPYVTLEGEILSEGRAVADATVTLNGNQSVTTNQFGKYKFEKIEYGSSVSLSAAKTGLTFYPAAMELSKVVKNQDNLNFYVANSVSGRVTVQGSGFGLGNMSIEVTGSTKTSVTTDYGGNFVVLGLGQGGTFELTPKAGGYSFTPASRRFTSLRESSVGQNFVAVKETYTVRGYVNVGGKPIRNAMVSISKRALKYYTDDDGNFEIANLDYGGPYTVSVLSKEHHFEPIVIEVLDKSMDIEFSTDISLGGIVLSGGKPLPGVTIDVNGRKYKTDDSGKYLITGLKYDGDYLLSFSAPGIVFSPSQKEYTAVKKSVLNEMFNASAIINGRVTFNGKALAGAAVTISGDSNVYKSDANGYFLIQNLPLGQDYTLEVASPGYKFDPPKREYKNLDSGKMNENFKAVIEGFVIKGTVTAEGRPLKKVPVSIEGTSKAQVFTDDNGQFVIEGLAANKRYELTVQSKLYTFEVPSGIIESLDSDKEISLEPGKTASPRDIETASTAQTRKDLQQNASMAAAKTHFRISGKITLDGKALKDVAIKTRFGEAYTNAAGEYSISLESGDNIDIEPYLSGYSFRPERVSMKDVKAASSNVNFTAHPAVHALSGFILNKEMKGVKGVSIKELNSPDDFMTDSKGVYKIKGLKHKATNIIVPESDNYNFYPANLEIVLENDLFANDIYAYPKKIKKPEAFIYGGINSEIYTAENYVSIVMVSPDGGRVSVKIADASGNIVKEFETNITADMASAIHWDGLASNGSEVKKGDYTVVLNGAGFKEDSLNFRVSE